MAITNSISEVWSAIVELKAQEQSKIAQVTSGIYQADATNTKVIHTVGFATPTIGDYTPGGLTYADLTDDGVDIDMNQKKFYSFKVEDIDQAQSAADVERPALIQAGRGLALAADAYSFGLYGDAGTSLDDGDFGGTAGDALLVDGTNIDTAIGKAMEVLDVNNAGEDRALIVSPGVFRVIVDDLRGVLTDNVNVVKTGMIEDYYGFRVYKSNQLSVTAGGTDGLDGYHCLAMTNRALPFAMSITESENMRLESSFATAHRGLMVFGAAIKHPTEVVDLFLRS
jgi:hypothetical protein